MSPWISWLQNWPWTPDRHSQRNWLACGEYGTATAIGHPHDATLSYLQRQLPVVQRQGYRLSLVSEVLAQKVASAPTVLSSAGAE